MTLDNEPTSDTTTDPTGPAPERPAQRRRRAASRPAGPPQADASPGDAGGPDATAEQATPARPPRKRAAKKTAASEQAREQPAEQAPEQPAEQAPEQQVDPAAEAAPARKRATRKRATRKTAAEPPPEGAQSEAQSVTEIPATEPAAAPTDQVEAAPPEPAQPETDTGEATAQAPPATAVLFQAPEPVAPVRRRRRAASRPAGPPQPAEEQDPSEQAVQRPEDERDGAPEPEGAAQAAPGDEQDAQTDQDGTDQDQDQDDQDQTGEDQTGEDQSDQDRDDESGDGRRRRRRRGGRGRRRRPDDSDGGDDSEATADGGRDDQRDRRDQADTAGSADDSAEDTGEDGGADEGDGDDQEDSAGGSTKRRRRRRRRGGGGDGEGEPGPDDPPNTVVKVRQPRKASDDVTSIKGSTRLEAKRQRRREGRDAGRRRQVITEAEFLARRESVERAMVVRERHGRTQIAVLEDGVLVEHYVARKSHSSMIGNVYLGKVQNVLPSMEAAFVDIGKGRNAVLYAGEVNWDAAGLEGQPKRIEVALKSGDPVLVQVTKDPVGHKGARLTSQVSLPGRYLVYVPRSSMTGISRKLPDTERTRLKKILKSVLPEDAGVIVRTAAEGASEEELSRDVERLQARWEDIEKRSRAANPPTMLYGEPDLAIKVVRDVFNEDFTKLVVSGDEAWDTVHEYVSWVAPDLQERLQRWDGEDDVFAAHRIDEQIAKALERKVWLPSGGSLVIDRTEAMTVVDVNTGKFTGSGGNLEETVTRNNLEAAEEIVRQLRLRDIGGIIVVDFIDMVLESNRDLVLRRMLECLGRDRTKHQVAEVTSLGLVQMTRKRVGQGLLEAFSEPCEHCGGRGVVLHEEPVEANGSGNGSGSQPRRRGSAKDVAAATLRGSIAKDGDAAPEPVAPPEPVVPPEPVIPPEPAPAAEPDAVLAVPEPDVEVLQAADADVPAAAESPEAGSGTDPV